MAHPFEKLRRSISVGGRNIGYFNLGELPNVKTLPFTIRVLLESAVRNCDGLKVTEKDVERILDWQRTAGKEEIAFMPARVLMQDFTGVPAVVDLAAMRDAVARLGGHPENVNPLVPVDLVIDHSVQVDFSGSKDAAEKNAAMEFDRNKERFAFLKWGSRAFDGLRIVPPGFGIVHQVNLEYLARVAFERSGLVYPDSLVGTDSHTTMINGLGVLGWGVGGIEAESAMLGTPMSFLLPPVVGFRLSGALQNGVTATDLVLTATAMLRKHGVVGKFVEFYGEGSRALSLADRATIANMAPEYGATCGFFPVDQTTVQYLSQTGRTTDQIKLITEYYKAVGLFNEGGAGADVQYTEHLELDLGAVEPCVSGPKRPHDMIPLKQLKEDFGKCMATAGGFKGFGVAAEDASKVGKLEFEGKEYPFNHGDVVMAAITSCTNTSNPSVMLGAGLVAKKAVEKGLAVAPYIKTSLAPGSGVASLYLESSGLLPSLEKLGFHIVGYGCTTCIGNSGELKPGVGEVLRGQKMVGSAVLSGNRNFEARVHPDTVANYLCSPPLVVAFALAGRTNINLLEEPLGTGSDGKPVYLKDIWPTTEEVNEVVAKHCVPKFFEESYATLTVGGERWQALQAPDTKIYPWPESTYIHNPPFFQTMQKELPPRKPIENAHVLLYLGDSITTDHISPAGRIAPNSPAARFLKEQGVESQDFNTYGSRRGNDEIMARGTFANTRIGNKIVGEGVTGPVTVHYPSGEKMAIFDAADKYQKAGMPTVIFAGKEYGSGSSRDWAAKGPFLQGVKAVIAESFERIHRSNLAGMGIVPLTFKPGQTAQSVGVKPEEKYTIELPEKLVPGMDITVKASGGAEFQVVLRLDTQFEIVTHSHGGLLNYVVRELASQAAK
eukprot:TRINITY_DN2980_c0_g1_i1.p1 TRINITY_DN2980_c0_g1~~TRINITY_DN2980_c0_g1_i1.p1  ORF type:complete len:908 (-),score=293.11 TRINITY_DN2980_c0_g1_i1:420-3092(-)